MKCLLPLLSLFAATALPAAEFRLPFTGVWFVGQGGDTLNVNHHMAPAVRPQWYGIDFVKAGGPGDRALSKSGGKALEDFYAWGAEVVAPTAGEIIAATNEFPDNAIGKTDTANPLGNHVVIKADEHTFVYLCHLQQGSVKVKVGDRVTAGQLLGLCGNSGNTSQPHIHLHVQDVAEFRRGTGQPIVFNHIDVTLSGKQFSDVNWPMLRGLFVSPHALEAAAVSAAKATPPPAAP